VNASYKTLIEPASEFYYYIYVTLPGDEWNPSAWGLTKPVTVLPPVDVTRDELLSCMSHLKWLVDTSTLSDGIKQSLFSKLEAAGLKIDNAYATGNLDKLPEAVGLLEGFINEIESDNEAASYTDSETWKEQAGYIINRVEAAVI